jgi:predicted Ser/Thr protein kinase
MAQSQYRKVPVDELLDDDIARKILAYPSVSDEILQARIEQVKTLGITSFELYGPVKFEQDCILGKGVVGLVVAATTNENSHVAVKIRRTDSRRRNMEREADLLKMANQAQVGPQYHASTADVLVMEYVNGMRLPVWLGQVKGRNRSRRVRNVVRNLVEQTVKLDAYGIDHGELSRAHKNILVNSADRAWIVDFESASQMRRVNNFTSLVQYVFIGNSFGRQMRRILGPINNEQLLNYLRMYKTGQTNDAFTAIKQLLKLEN